MLEDCTFFLDNKFFMDIFGTLIGESIFYIMIASIVNSITPN